MEFRDKILIESALLFKTYGIRSVTMDDIARQLAISKKTLYRHFKDKEEIVKQTVLAILQENKQNLDQITSETSDILEEIIKYSHYIRCIIRSIHPTMVHDLQKYYPDIWMLYEGFEHHIYQVLVKNIGQGIEKGVFREDINPNILAKMRLKQIQFAFDPSIFPPQEYELVEVQMEFFEHFIRGLFTQKGLQRYEKFLNQERHLT